MLPEVPWSVVPDVVLELSCVVVSVVLDVAPETVAVGSAVVVVSVSSTCSASTVSVASGASVVGAGCVISSIEVGPMPWPCVATLTMTA